MRRKKTVVEDIVLDEARLGRCLLAKGENGKKYRFTPGTGRPARHLTPPLLEAHLDVPGIPLAEEKAYLHVQKYGISGVQHT